MERAPETTLRAAGVAGGYKHMHFFHVNITNKEADYQCFLQYMSGNYKHSITLVFVESLSGRDNLRKMCSTLCIRYNRYSFNLVNKLKDNI